MQHKSEVGSQCQARTTGVEQSGLRLLLHFIRSTCFSAPTAQLHVDVVLSLRAESLLQLDAVSGLLADASSEINNAAYKGRPERVLLFSAHPDSGYAKTSFLDSDMDSNCNIELGFSGTTRSNNHNVGNRQGRRLHSDNDTSARFPTLSPFGST